MVTFGRVQEGTHIWVYPFVFNTYTVETPAFALILTHTQPQNHNQRLIFWNKKGALSGWHTIRIRVYVCEVAGVGNVH